MIRVTTTGVPYRQRVRSAAQKHLHGAVDVSLATTHSARADEPMRQQLRLSMDERNGDARLVEIDANGRETVLWDREHDPRELVRELAGEDCRRPVSVDGEGRRVYWLAPGWHQVGCGTCLVCRARMAIGTGEGEFYDPSKGDGPSPPMPRRHR